MSTRDKILKEALNLFSTKGFDSVIGKRYSLYRGNKGILALQNHFKNKQDIC
jgi:hypothetical protein